MHCNLKHSWYKIIWGDWIQIVTAILEKIRGAKPFLNQHLVATCWDLPVVLHQKLPITNVTAIQYSIFNLIQYTNLIPIFEKWGYCSQNHRLLHTILSVVYVYMRYNIGTYALINWITHLLHPGTSVIVHNTVDKTCKMTYPSVTSDNIKLNDTPLSHKDDAQFAILIDTWVTKLTEKWGEQQHLASLYKV